MSASLEPSAGQMTAAIASSMPARLRSSTLVMSPLTKYTPSPAGFFSMSWITTTLVVNSSPSSSATSSRAVEFQPQTTMWSRNPAAPMPMPSLSRYSIRKPTSAPVMAATMPTPNRTSNQLVT